MWKTFAAIVVLTVVASAARADEDTPFDEERVCRDERGSAQFAARVPASPNDAEAVARVDRARRNLAAATKGKATYKRRLDEATADLERLRAGWKADVARRDATAKALADCVETERQAHLARTAARRAEEQRKADEEAARRARIQYLMNSKPIVRLALSALVCVENSDRANALRAIADEKRYARIGGVQNNAKLYELQQDVRDSDQRRTRFNRELKSRKTAAIKCSDAKVKQVATCISSPIEEGPCLVEEIAGPLQVVRVIELGE